MTFLNETVMITLKWITAKVLTCPGFAENFCLPKIITTTRACRMLGFQINHPTGSGLTKCGTSSGMGVLPWEQAVSVL